MNKERFYRVDGEFLGKEFSAFLRALNCADAEAQVFNTVSDPARRAGFEIQRVTFLGMGTKWWERIFSKWMEESDATRRTAEMLGL